MILTDPKLHQTRVLFLRTVALCYAFAFLSLYPQIPGLYGANGVTPAYPKFQKLPDTFPRSEGQTALQWIKSFHPNLLKPLKTMLGLSVDLTMDVICLAGTILAMIMVLKPSWNIKLNFILLWLGYKSIFSVGQTFLHFQWDILLLETGFLSIIVAPFWKQGPAPWDRINMFLVRWLLFRMMFSSGVVKLLSGCPAWWGLTAMPVHYESQCLPTWMAWFAYHGMPEFMHKLSVVVTYIIEIPLTLLFFAPTQNLRKFTFRMQIVLMISIMLTGNYNFFNILFIGLCFSLVDDSWMSSKKSNGRNSSSGVAFLLTLAFNLISYLALAALIFKSFFVFEENALKILLNFDEETFKKVVERVAVESVPWTLVLFGLVIISALVRSLFESKGILSKVFNLGVSACYGGIGLFMFAIAVPRFLHGMGIQQVPDVIPKNLISVAGDLDHLDLTHSYGLFRSMTGIGGRPEVVIEVAKSKNAIRWTEVEFPYKPGALETAPKFLLPHQPRLDWQMWFAALGHYQHNPWLISLLYRILENKAEVLDLLDPSYRLKNEKPKAARILLYHYHFTEFGLVLANIQSYEMTNKMRNWWWREFKDDYLPAVDLVDLKPIMIQMGYLDSNGKDHNDVVKNQDLAKVLLQLRTWVQVVPHHLLVQSLLLGVIPMYLQWKRSC